MKKYVLLVTLMFTFAFLFGCLEPEPDRDITPPIVNNTDDDLVDIPNPASVYCEENGGTLEIRSETGGEIGYCIFDNGSECEEWAYYRGECEPEVEEPIGMANPASVYCEENNGTLEIRNFTNGEKGFCVFVDGSECEEWAYYREECEPGKSFCKDFCGDGICQEIVCEAVGCPCAETWETCSEDCEKPSNLNKPLHMR
jgi:hypothetical protein